MCRSLRLGEAKLLGREAFQKLAKCEIGDANVNNDMASTLITQLEYLMTQKHRSSRTHEKLISLNATTYYKCDT